MSGDIFFNMLYNRCFIIENGSVRFAVRLTPNAALDTVDDIIEDAEGKILLKARVRAVPEKGKANKALIKLLAKQWRLPASSFELLSGETSRIKIIRISGDTAQIINAIYHGYTANL